MDWITRLAMTSAELLLFVGAVIVVVVAIYFFFLTIRRGEGVRAAIRKFIKTLLENLP